MSKLSSLEELRKLKEEARRSIQVRESTGTKITVGMGTCGINAGARETMYAVLEEMQRRNIEAHVSTVGCIGMCAQEPLVTIEQAGTPGITYGKVTADKVPKLIRSHLVDGTVVSDWVVSRGAEG